MGQRIAGTAYVKAGGKQYDLRGSFTVSPSRIKREGVAGQDGVHGFIETQRVPFIKADLSTTAGLTIAELDAMEDVTVTAELANGKNYVLSGAWTEAAHEIDTAAGKVAVNWGGLSCDEL
ncbi:phage tail tube protein [Methylobacterium sp. J-070]|uniref:phage tail tube protein n=1 Tax=Methylobacterium sp. J-070 TaxID=2836650 RepID=UPI001FBB093B|nr:phage tail tube protein [Methylobacterium sp. J-070]MCJ2053994.1 phage tail tube protein [Methylobacterium sp. J-070]